MNEPFYRLMVLGLLAGILFVQVANHERPLTLAAYKAANNGRN
jgi:hypothetical protein